MAETYELLIENGTVVDGSGERAFAAAVGVRDGRLKVIFGETENAVEAGRRIDATGLVVAPGFIDLHSHSGLMIFADPLHQPKVRQGVTTEVIGVDGLSYAPIPDPEDLEALAHMNAGLDGRPDIAYDWASVESYLDRLDGLHPSLNLAFMVGNSALRLGAIGWDEVEASDADIANMRAMLREAMEQGAIGVSSGLDYPPGAYASTDELAQLTAQAAAHGGFYHTHVRYSLGDRYLDPFLEAIEIGRRGEGPTHITHFYHRQTFPDGPGPMLALVDDARAEGLDVTFDTYPYEWASTRLLIMIPPWVQAGGPIRTKSRLSDMGVRNRIRRELSERGVQYAGRRAWDDVRLGAFTQPDLLRWEGRTLGELIAERGQDPVDVLCDLLLEEDLAVNQVTPGPWSESLREFIRHPVGMIGTDSTFVGEKPSPRTYGSFPRVLGQFVREESLISLEEAVRSMTSAAAERIGLADRGLIRDGFVADLVVLDPDRVRSNATYDEPRRFPDGIDWVVVAGEIVVERGEHTGARSGRVLRSAR